MYFTYTSLDRLQNLVLSSVNIFTVSERSAAMFVLLAVPCNMEYITWTNVSAWTHKDARTWYHKPKFDYKSIAECYQYNELHKHC
jgi:hypothetical protein